MPCSLPPEIIDLILEYLCNEPITLKACCLASKSWIPRTRKHLFACIRFGVFGPTIRSWMKAFPDPADSPAHHARHLWISETNAINAPCIRSFHHVEVLRVSAFYRGKSGEAPLVRLHGLSPTLKCLHLSHFSVPLSDIFNLVCSFPLLEDLTLHCEEPASVSDGWIPPLTSPRFTGTLRLIEEIRLPARGLLALSGSPRFTNIEIVCPVEYAGSAMDLVSGCSDTLESLCIGYRPSGAFPSIPEVCQYLTGGV
ncbi:hypothetical protein BJ322DRAFT_288067 [Thelephora terrestris]|uniref:F-box domain-containing protein n=1 Tax=Thelephora terrestris TaxID=56493 RepID=A0A9P6H742_9AGAM|nr:hypothetical protein BJ322DRAFT_288067 [Thelephora terrestris]